ncbi:MAG: hypothetical protein PWP28_1659, partial [Oceanotoga sp.]|nr:hypothetical protein [Oceanotoga sp.]
MKEILFIKKLINIKYGSSYH